MSLRIAFLAADTTRSSAYAQVLAGRGMAPHVVMYGDGLTDRPGRGSGTAPVTIDGVTVDTSRSVSAVAHDAGWPCSAWPTDGANDAGPVQAVRDAAPDVILFSGYGGELARAALLDLGVDVLHIHAGRLPGYRGSTTPYYMLLDHGEIEATAILLTSTLDGGAIVGRRSHPAPAAGTDIDHVLDPAIRAALAADVLAARADAGRWSTRELQHDVEADRPYHVIHPVLKHIAILALPTADG